tara:strand:+ start:2217 stop:2453 length:237 start_codon:yes stop_codon:yes gene_type:complete
LIGLLGSSVMDGSEVGSSTSLSQERIPHAFILVHLLFCMVWINPAIVDPTIDINTPKLAKSTISNNKILIYFFYLYFI